MPREFLRRQDGTAIMQPMLEAEVRRLARRRTTLIRAADALGPLVRAPGGADVLVDLALDTGEDDRTRATAVWLLGWTDGTSPRTAWPLIALLRDRTAPAPVRTACADAFWHLDTRRVIPALIHVVADPSDDAAVRGACAWTLGWTGDARAVAPLVTVLDDRTQPACVRAMCAEMLAEVHDESAVEPVLRACEDPVASVRFWALFATSELVRTGLADADRVLAACRRVLEEDDRVVRHFGSVRRAARQALALGTGQRLPFVAPALRPDYRAVVRAFVSAALGPSGLPRARGKELGHDLLIGLDGDVVTLTFPWLDRSVSTPWTGDVPALLAAADGFGRSVGAALRSSPSRRRWVRPSR